MIVALGVGEFFLQYKTILLVKFSPPPQTSRCYIVSDKAELPISTITCIVYLPPLPTLSAERFHYALSQFQPSTNIILLGNFNLPNINWDTLTGISAVDDAFCDMCFQFNLLQLITCPAHIHGNTLDLNNDDLLDNISVCCNNNNPDCIQFISCQTTPIY